MWRTSCPLREMEMTPEDKKRIRGFMFLSEKPILYVLNIGESTTLSKDLEEAVAKYGIAEVAARPNTGALAVCAKVEAELAEMSDEDAAEFLSSYGLQESGLVRLIRKTYELLGLISFFTVGEDECRAWTVERGSKAVEAAGAIHTDLSKHFIRAETIHWDQLLEAGSEAEARCSRHPAPGRQGVHRERWRRDAHQAQRLVGRVFCTFCLSTYPLTTTLLFFSLPMNPILTSIVLGLTAAAANVFGGTVIVQRTWERRYLRYFVALGAGFMLATAMVEMVPESLALAGRKGALLILAGYLIVHLFEHTITPHFHYGEETHADEFVHSHKRMSVLVGLMIHTFFDGIAITSGFLISTWLGWVIFLAVFLHKIPEGFTVTSVMLASGLSKRKFVVCVCHAGTGYPGRRTDHGYRPACR